MNISNVDGWEKGGRIAGQSVFVIATNKHTDAVCYLSVNGPTESSETSYVVCVGTDIDEVGYRKIIARNINNEQKARQKAIEFMNNHPFVKVNTSTSYPTLLNKQNEKIYP